MKKKILFLITIIVSFFLTNCSSSEDFYSSNNQKTHFITLNAGLSQDANSRTQYVYGDLGNGTNGLKVNWESTDEIIIYAGSVSSSTKSILSNPIISSDKKTAKFSGNIIANDGDVLYAYVKGNNIYIDETKALISSVNLIRGGSIEDASTNDVIFGTATYSEGNNSVNLSLDQKCSFLKLTLNIDGVPTGTKISNIRISNLQSGYYLNAKDFTKSTEYRGGTRINEVQTGIPFYFCFDCENNVSHRDIYIYADLDNKPYCSKLGTYNLSNGKLYSSTRKLETFAGGNGSIENPYQIGSPTQMKLLSMLISGQEKDKSNSKYYHTLNYIQIQDINLDEVGYYWVPILVFSGIYDGNNKKISGTMRREQDNKGQFGLFRYLATNGIVKNVNFTGKIDLSEGAAPNLGSIVGDSYKGSIINCTNYASMEDKWATYMGGIVGSAYGTTIEACQNFGSISLNRTQCYAGGICGSTSTGGTSDNPGSHITIIGCINKAASINNGSGIMYFGQGADQIISNWSSSEAISADYLLCHVINGTLSN